MNGLRNPKPPGVKMKPVAYFSKDLTIEDGEIKSSPPFLSIEKGKAADFSDLNIFFIALVPLKDHGNVEKINVEATLSTPTAFRIMDSKFVVNPKAIINSGKSSILVRIPLHGDISESGSYLMTFRASAETVHSPLSIVTGKP